jgi:hypothetical protein
VEIRVASLGAAKEPRRGAPHFPDAAHHADTRIPTLSMKNLRDRLIGAIRRTVLWGERRVPRGVRSIVGVLLIMGGVVGFLPILGFWMIPAGLALIALDIPALRRRLLAWALRGEASAPGTGRSDR